MCELLLDTDVLIKFGAYGLLDKIEHPGCGEECDQQAGLVTAAKFSARRALARKASDPATALAHLEAFFLIAHVLEPTEEEILLAADLEEAATQAGGSLDIGESQLCAIAINRGRPVILTGDKRAVAAAEQLVGSVPALARLTERLACLEQAAALAVQRLGALTVRAMIIAEPKVDTALSICFQFTNPAVADDFYPHGLRSYIEDVRRAAPTMLLPGEVLTLP